MVKTGIIVIDLDSDKKCLNGIKFAVDMFNSLGAKFYVVGTLLSVYKSEQVALSFGMPFDRSMVGEAKSNILKNIKALLNANFSEKDLQTLIDIIPIVGSFEEEMKNLISKDKIDIIVSGCYSTKDISKFLEEVKIQVLLLKED